MPELRRDPVAGYWTIISTERGWRPVEYKQRKSIEERACPFCEGHESETESEVFAIRKEGTAPNSPGWDVRVVNSRHPILENGGMIPDRYGQGIYDVMDGVGRHELIIETPRHQFELDDLSLGAVEKVVEAYVERFRSLEHDNRFKYALLFKNHGQISGSARDIIRHARSQIIATPITPKRVKEELLVAKNYFDYRNRCVFCDILRQEKNESSRIVSENGSFLSFCPFASRHPFEVWILPKKHSADFGRLPFEDFSHLAHALKDCLTRLKILLQDPPYNVILHTAPFRHSKKEVYWKTIDEDYHWYLQISPRLTQNAGFEWGSGIYINATPPEDAARILRAVAVDEG
jgi:UDPglucose--hexose-1-phosphate uridylyltransferase